MLVLTRKLDEQIVIGDDIKVTLLRIRGNSVRIGIEAPREVRVVRGEIELKERPGDGVETGDPDVETSDPQQQVFAHPQPPRGSRKNKSPVRSSGRVSQLFVGRVADRGGKLELASVPNAAYRATEHAAYRATERREPDAAFMLAERHEPSGLEREFSEQRPGESPGSTAKSRSCDCKVAGIGSAPLERFLTAK